MPRRSLGAFIPAVGRRWPRRSRLARKAAKKTRYATEPARASLGKPAKRLGKRVKAVQKVLGDHQDTVVARDALRHLALAAHAAGEPGLPAVRPGASRGQRA
ncbi:CHAD domain-containing protein [Streptomyces mirabilis]|jgi:CHAD domain-containing protein|uniref:CHAD domain-containing protein n=1 Tax=Streptomyces mirabilis TaxID=68239 RepID=A0A1I2W9K1_9ACTN|nr:CHAD domain-containing protein [Streptomyces mirabilis]